MKIIGFTSQMQHGKDTSADYLASKLVGYTRVAFASSVKRVFCDSFGVDLDFVETWKVQSALPPGFDSTVRQSLQFIGDGFRKIQSNIWVELCFKFNEPPMIISDARYLNELKKIKELGGINILIWRPGFENDDPNGSEAQIRPLLDWCAKFIKEGPTGFDFDGFPLFEDCHAPDGTNFIDFFLKNDGTKEELYQKIDAHLVPYVKSKFGEV